MKKTEAWEEEWLSSLPEEQEGMVIAVWSQEKKEKKSWWDYCLTVWGWIGYLTTIAILFWVARFNGPEFVKNLLIAYWYLWNIFFLVLVAVVIVAIMLIVTEQIKPFNNLAPLMLGRVTINAYFRPAHFRQKYNWFIYGVLILTLFGFGWWFTAIWLILCAVAKVWLQLWIKEAITDFLAFSVKNAFLITQGGLKRNEYGETDVK